MFVGRPESRLGTAPPVAQRSRWLRRRARYRRRRRMAAALQRVCGALTLLCALFGLPAALIPTRQVWWSELDVAAAVAQPLSPPVLLLAAMGTGCLLWAWLVVGTVLDAAAVFTRTARTLRLLPAPLQTTVTTLAGSLLMAITSVTAAASAAGVTPPAGTATHTAGPPTAALPASAAETVAAVPDLMPVSADTTLQLSPTVGPRSAMPHVTHAAQGRPMTVTVRRGDTLWSISERCLGDPHRWQEIYRLNAGRYDRAGRMRGGHHIEPTWVLTLPVDAEPSASTGHTDPSGGAGTPPPATAPGQSSSPGPSTTTTTTTTEQARDDGITGQHPSGIASVPVTPRTVNPTAGQPGQAGRADSGDRTNRGGAPGVGLFTGSWVDAGLAGAIIAAAALVWAHRRRRYMPRTPSASTRPDDTDITDLPAVVRKLRRATATSTTDVAVDAAAVIETTDGHATGGQHDSGSVGSVAASGTDLHHDAATDEDRGEAAAEQSRFVPGWGRSVGLGLAGPGSEAAARGLLVTAVADGPDNPADRSVVLIPTPTAARLFGTGHALPDTPRIVITNGLPEALDQLEAVTLHRSRILHQHAVDTVAELRRVDPLEEPLPPTILLADTDILDEDRGRVTALLRQGHRLDVHGVLLGTWPPGDTVTVAADGTTSQTSQHENASTATPTDGSTRHAVDLGRLTVLTVGEAVDLLNVLAESQTGQLSTAAFDSPAPDETSDPDAGDTQGATPEPDASQPSTALEARSSRSTGCSDQPPAAGTTEPDVDTDADAGAAASRANGDTTGRPIRRVAVELLGAPRVVDADTSKGTLRAKSLELLAYLAVHDGAVHYESILDDLLPDAPARKAVHRLHTYISDLRQILRRTGGHDTYITRTGQRYQLNRDAFDVDLWQMRTALHQAELADNPADRNAAWQQALQAYQGHLADGVDYEWIEPHREAARRQAVDAALALAATLKDQPETVIPILDRAITHSPYTEALYQAAMRANAAASRLDTVRALRHTLARQLADIDAEPSEETTALADQLLTASPATPHHNRRNQQPNQPDASATPPADQKPTSRTGQAADYAPDPPTPRPAGDTDTGRGTAA
ncbi:BTAD domain-containing putative transcriptional regulator [Dactylosporangium cerinum]|uniref:BTAD domain-containing putative transcriptional regulator n=1 Tax=Dactylosporangium cerinum TaxID=1434730 RepID=A0ABV9W8U4_9ACTN